MNIKKFVGYAYPSSPIAKQEGHSGTGCWFLTVGDDANIRLEDIVFSSIDESSVQNKAKEYNYPWSMWTNV